MRSAGSQSRASASLRTVAFCGAASPASMRPIVLRLTPARSASSAWVRSRSLRYSRSLGSRSADVLPEPKPGPVRKKGLDMVGGMIQVCNEIDGFQIGPGAVVILALRKPLDDPNRNQHPTGCRAEPDSGSSRTAVLNRFGTRSEHTFAAWIAATNARADGAPEADGAIGTGW